MAREEQTNDRWLVLIHQLPPRPSYLRVKIWRRLQRLGAVAVKNTVYVLPRTDQAREDFEWVLREIAAGGGDGSVCEARFTDGLSDDGVEALFQQARQADYAAIAEEIRRVPRPPAGSRDGAARREQEAALARLRKRLGEVVAIDFFGAPGREKVEALLAAAEARARPPVPAPKPPARPPERPRGGTWVTRKGVYVDRIASAWLIRRFIDAQARFKFVAGKGYRPERGELRFDMFEAEFTHEGDRCTFEVLLQRFAIGDPALAAIGEIVHDIDLRDGKFGRDDALGFERIVAGVAMAHEDDDVRLARAGAMLDDLYAYFTRKPPRREKDR